MKKTNKERGAALVGIEMRNKSDLEPLIERMRAIPLSFRKLSGDDPLYDHIV
jgi:threonine dehydratase